MTKKNLESNPVRKYRVSAGLSQQAFSKFCNISVQSVYLTENGVYEVIPKGIRDYMLRKQVDLDTITEEYIKFRLKLAIANSSHWQYMEFFLPPVDRTLNPLMSFREEILKLTANAMCISFMINPGLYKRVEEGMEYSNIPDNIILSLMSGGIPKDIVEELQERYKEFWEFQRYGDLV